MEEKDIQELFGHIKAHISPNAQIPKLTQVKAAVWCKQLTGYTLEQLKRAAEEWGAMKPFWPDLDELMQLLPPLPKRDSGMDVFLANGYKSETDYVAQMRAVIARSREEQPL